MIHFVEDDGHTLIVDASELVMIQPSLARVMREGSDIIVDASELTEHRPAQIRVPLADSDFIIVDASELTEHRPSVMTRADAIPIGGFAWVFDAGLRYRCRRVPEET